MDSKTRTPVERRKWLLAMPEQMVPMMTPSTTSSCTRNTSLHSLRFPPPARITARRLEVESRRCPLHALTSVSARRRQAAAANAGEDGANGDVVEHALVHAQHLLSLVQVSAADEDHGEKA